MGALYHSKDYLGPKGLAIAFKAFVRPVCEYGNVAIIGASPTHLSKLDKQAERLSGSTFPTLHSRRCASAIGYNDTNNDTAVRMQWLQWQPDTMIPTLHSSHCASAIR